MESVNAKNTKSSPGNGLSSRKGKSKKSKTNEYDNQNINMKKSFTKFDDLQKRNLIHTPVAEQLDNCRQCKKPVYIMEEVILQLKTGTNIFHKTCLRCKDCGKQLKPDSYNVHDGNLFCSMHFKLIFAPKIVYEEITPRKPELIIRENQPIELPPDVARGKNEFLSLIHWIVKSKYYYFNNHKEK
uniref:Pollen-specific protein SF3 isoform X2 n=1 Tax=Drosophila rhopaloa TaxID=1041015 RepID=A0A6P4E4B7_DRORH